MFLCFEGPEFDVVRDACKSFMTVNLSQRPGVAHEARLAPVRVVCSNTNDFSRSRAQINVSIPHHANMEARLLLAAELVKAFGSATEKTRETFERFARVTIDDKGLEELFEAAFETPALPIELRMLEKARELGKVDEFKSALPEDFDEDKLRRSHEKSVERVKSIRDAARVSFEEFNPTHLRGTVWAGYNAVTEVADWREGRNADLAAFCGSRRDEKVRGFEAALKLVGGK